MEKVPFQKLGNAGKSPNHYPRIFKVKIVIKLQYVFRHRHTGKLYAVKISKREGGGTDGMRDDEIQILIKFGQHPNIITVKVNVWITLGIV